MENSPRSFFFHMVWELKFITLLFVLFPLWSFFSPWSILSTLYESLNIYNSLIVFFFNELLFFPWNIFPIRYESVKTCYPYCAVFLLQTFFHFFYKASIYRHNESVIEITQNIVFHELQNILRLIVTSSDIIYSWHHFSSKSVCCKSIDWYFDQFSTFVMCSWFYLQTQDVFLITTLSLRKDVDKYIILLDYWYLINLLRCY